MSSVMPNSVLHRRVVSDDDFSDEVARRPDRVRVTNDDKHQLSGGNVE